MNATSIDKMLLIRGADLFAILAQLSLLLLLLWCERISLGI